MTVIKVNSWGQGTGITWHEGVETIYSPNRAAMLIKNGLVTKLTGKGGEGGLADASMIPANSTVKILFGSATPKRRDIHIFLNPALLEKASISHAGILHADLDTYELAIYLSCFKQVNLDDYDWLAGIQVCD